MTQRRLSRSCDFRSGQIDPETVVGYEPGAADTLIQLNGPRCIGASRGPTSSSVRRISGTHQFTLKIEKRVAFALRSCGYVQIVGGATRLAAAVHLNVRRGLAVEQGHWLVPRWRHAPLQEWSDGPCVRIRCLSFDHMIGRQYPRSVEPNAPLPRQVQHRECCGR